jgi:adenine-specific DNA-methyltransferase
MDLRNIDTWRERLGLLPVPLFQDSDDSLQFVLLNGSDGNFCLDLSDRAPDAPSARSFAWSSNVGHYISLSDRKVTVQHWSRRTGRAESYSQDDIATSLEKFHRYLEKTGPDSNRSVVTHGARAFRSLRTALGRDVSGPEALKAFLLLLACAQDGVDYRDVDLDRWNLDPDAVDTASQAGESDWSSLVEDFVRGRSIDDLHLRVDLLLRHASGLLFQEAHYEALLSNEIQLGLGLFPPDPARISKKKRERGYGVHFTPPALARTLVEEALGAFPRRECSTISVFDPACGSGEFLREALRQLRLRGFSGEIKIEGWDLSPAACAMARFALAWDVVAGPGKVRVRIESRDSIAPEHPWPVADLLLMNPPFVSWQNMNPEQRDSVSRVLGEKKKNRPDLSSAFLFKAATSVAEHGVLGCIVPASFFDTGSASFVRQQLGETLSPRLVARLGSHMLFPGAIIDAGLYVAQADASRTEPPVAFWADYRPRSSSAGLRELRRIRSDANRLSYPIEDEGYSIYPNPELGTGTESWAPRPYKSWQLLQRLSIHPRVQDLFTVHQGARTGHNKALLLSREEWASLPKSERAYFRPAVLNESLQDGLLKDVAYVFFPYGDKELENEQEVARRLPAYFRRYLAPHRDTLLERKDRPQDRWWELARPRQGAWQTKPVPKIVSTYFGERGSFAWDEKGNFVVVQGYAWLPKSGAFSLPFDGRLALAYLALLNSHLFSELLSATSNHVGGGQWDLSTRFVGKIPISRLDSDTLDQQVLDDLAAEGQRIHASGLPETQSGKDSEAVRAAYGLVS